MNRAPPPKDRIRPHIPYHWDGRQFTTRLIAPGIEATWLVDSMLPILARIDTGTNRIDGPISVAHSEHSGIQGAREAHGLAVRGDEVWIRWNGAVTRYEHSSRLSKLIPVPGVGIAAGAEGVWTNSGRQELTRIDREEVETVALELGGDKVSTQFIDTGHGLVFAGSVDLRAERDWRAVVTSIDPGSAQIVRRTEAPGMLQWLTVDRSAVWLNVWRRIEGSIRSLLLQLDPASLEARSELELKPVGASGALIDGELWMDMREPYEPETWRNPDRVRRLDAATGKVLSELSLDGWADWWVAGPKGPWATFGGKAGVGAGVMEIRADSETVRIHDPRTLDISGLLPAPPGPIDAGECERSARDQVAAALLSGVTRRDVATGIEEKVPFINGAEFQEVHLEGSFPDTAVVALFRFGDHPGLLFGRRWRIWADDGALVADLAVWMTNLHEDYYLGPGLSAERKPDSDGVIWL